MSDSKVVLITGASTGIGAACAEYLGSKGYRVYGTSRRAGSEPSSSGSFTLLRMDVTDEASVAAGVDAILKREGRIDAVFNNAGIHTVGPVEDIPFKDIETSFQTNCFGAVRVCKAVIPVMRSQGGGSIINMSSIAGVIPLPYQAVYCGSKHALEGMTEALRAELRHFGIKVSIIEPGDIRHQDCHSKTFKTQAYEPYFSNAVNAYWADEEKGYPPEKIGLLVEKILKSPNPRMRYTFGQAFQSAGPVLRRLLPQRLFQWTLGKLYKY